MSPLPHFTNLGIDVNENKEREFAKRLVMDCLENDPNLLQEVICELRKQKMKNILKDG